MDDEQFKLRMRAYDLEAALRAIVVDERAGWGSEPAVECLYCGGYDFADGDGEFPWSGEHHPDCEIVKARELLDSLDNEEGGE